MVQIPIQTVSRLCRRLPIKVKIGEVSSHRAVYGGERAKRKLASLAPKLEDNDCQKVHLGSGICDGKGTEETVTRHSGAIELGTPAVGKVGKPFIASGDTSIRGRETVWLRGARRTAGVDAASSTVCNCARGCGPRRRQSCGYGGRLAPPTNLGRPWRSHRVNRRGPPRQWSRRATRA